MLRKAAYASCQLIQDGRRGLIEMRDRVIGHWSGVPMAAAYPTWFREKVITAYESGDGSFARIGERFRIGEATVNRWVSQKRRLRTLEPKKPTVPSRKRLVDDEGEQFLRDTLEELSCSTLRELAEAYEEEFSIKVDPRRMSEVVRRLGFTRKRGSSGRGLPRERMSWRRVSSS